MEGKKFVIPFKKLDPNAQAPMRAHSGPDADAGADCTAVSKSVAKTFGDERHVVKYGTGIAVAIPDGHWIDLRPRSSVYKTGMSLCNSVGTIDASYRGEICAMFYSDDFCKEYDAGDRVCQLVVMPDVDPADVEFVEVDELPETERGTGGFGSSGK